MVSQCGMYCLWAELLNIQVTSTINFYSIIFMLDIGMYGLPTEVQICATYYYTCYVINLPLFLTGKGLQNVEYRYKNNSKSRVMLPIT